MPGTARSAAASCAPEAALPNTSTGCPAPAGKCWSSTACPATESGWPRNDCAFVSPLAFSPGSPRAIAPRSTAVVIRTTRGRTAMRRPIRAQMPRVVGSAEPYPGLTGQNTTGFVLRNHDDPRPLSRRRPPNLLDDTKAVELR